MTNINLYKCRSWSFFASSHRFCVFEIFIFQNVWPWKCRSNSCCTILVVAPFDGNYLTSYLMALVMFTFSSLVNIATWKVWPWKFSWRIWMRKTDLLRSIATINLHKSHNGQFCTSSYLLLDINILNFWPWKFKSRSWRRNGTHVVW